MWYNFYQIQRYLSHKGMQQKSNLSNFPLIMFLQCTQYPLMNYKHGGGGGGGGLPIPKRDQRRWVSLIKPKILCHYQVIPSHGNPQMGWTLFDGYLFKYCSVKHQTFHQVSEKTFQQTYSHQKTTWKAFQMPPRAIKHQLTYPIELTSGSFLIGTRGILVISRNRLVTENRQKYFL